MMPEWAFYLSFMVNIFIIAFVVYVFLQHRQLPQLQADPSRPFWNIQCAGCGRWLLFRANKTVAECMKLALEGNWITERHYGREFHFCNECRMIKE